MKFDIALARDILQKVEDRPLLTGMDHYQMPTPPNEAHHVLLEHIHLLIEAGLLQGHVEMENDAIPAYAFVERLTMAGHEFLANSRNETAWSTMEEATVKSGGRISLSAATAIMEDVALKSYGLDG